MEEITALIILVVVVVYVAIRLIIFWKASRTDNDRGDRQPPRPSGDQ